MARPPFFCCAALIAMALATSPSIDAYPQSDNGQWSPERSVDSLPLRGVSEVVWARLFGSENDDELNRIVATTDGSLVAVGFADRIASSAEWDGLAHRFAPDGSTLWTRRFGSAGLQALWGVAENSSGRLGLSGFAQPTGGGATDAWMLVVDGDGTLLVDQRFGGSATERATDIVACPDGGFLLVGQTDSIGAGAEDVYLVRTDADGETLWTRTYGGVTADRGFYAATTPDGGFAIAGVTGRAGAYDTLVIKIDGQGTELWRRVFGGEGNDPNHGINVLADGRIVVVGYTNGWGAREHDLLAVTLGPTGELLTRQMLGGPGDDRVMNSFTAADGGSWLVGYTTSFGDGDWDVMLARLTPEGTFEPWIGAIGTPYDDRGTTLVESEGGDLIVGGSSTATSSGEDADILLLRLDPNRIERLTDGVVARPIQFSSRAPR